MFIRRLGFRSFQVFSREAPILENKGFSDQGFVIYKHPNRKDIYTDINLPSDPLTITFRKYKSNIIARYQSEDKVAGFKVCYHESRVYCYAKGLDNARTSSFNTYFQNGILGAAETENLARKDLFEKITANRLCRTKTIAKILRSLGAKRSDKIVPPPKLLPRKPFARMISKNFPLPVTTMKPENGRQKKNPTIITLPAAINNEIEVKEIL